jgi:hypothetical protein
MHFSSDHHLELFKVTLLFVTLVEWQIPGLYRKNFQYKKPLLQNSNKIGSMSFSNLYNFWNKVDDFFVDDGNLMLLLITVPPS